MQCKVHNFCQTVELSATSTDTQKTRKNADYSVMQMHSVLPLTKHFSATFKVDELIGHLPFVLAVITKIIVILLRFLSKLFNCLSISYSNRGSIFPFYSLYGFLIVSSELQDLRMRRSGIHSLRMG